jgi:hypothetical protein
VPVSVGVCDLLDAWIFPPTKVVFLAGSEAPISIFIFSTLTKRIKTLLSTI